MLTVILFTNSNCKKPKSGEKKETVTVNGLTFGCRVDGVPFIADKWDYGNNIPPVHVSYWYDPIQRKKYVIARGKKQNEEMEIYINSPVVPGRKLLNNTTRPYIIVGQAPDYGMYYVRNPETEYITNSTIGGYVDIITADTITNKIEARFEFTGTDRISGKQVKVTDGYFKNF
jgi:hypothetical protein